MNCKLTSLILVGCSCACGGAAASGDARHAPASAPTVAAAGNTAAPINSAGPESPVIPSTGSAGQGPLITASKPTQNVGCKAGHYTGKFFGDYRSGAWLEGSETIMFATADVNERLGFEFWLESVDQPCSPGQEFCTGAIVKGGKLRGNATPFEDANDPSTMGGLGFSVRFEIDLTGELDCNSGKFRGKLENGCYDILSALYRFDGTITGDYSLSSHEFSAGVWHVDEKLMAGMDAPANPLGGNGQWSASFLDDTAPPSGPGNGLCSGQTGFDTEL
jgi:hypothetical protein